TLNEESEPIKGSVQRMDVSAVITERTKKVVVTLLAIITALMVGQALKMTMVATMPFVCAIYISLLLYPVKHHLDQRLPCWLSLTFTMLIFIVVIALFAGAIWISIEVIANKA